MHTIRLAQNKDASGIQAIYAPFVKNTVVSFEIEVPTVKEIAYRIENNRPLYPWLVSEFEGKITGYAYAGFHRKRKAYQWTTEVSVYIHPDFRKRRIATALYSALLDILKLQGFVNVYAGITVPNPESVNFHKAFGFDFFARYENVGYKFGAFQSTEWYQICLHEELDTPKELIRVEEVENDLGFLNILKAAEKKINSGG